MASRRTKLKKWDAMDHLRTERDIAEYWEAAQAESAANSDPGMLLSALGLIARAKGMEALAADLQVQRPGTYDAVLAGCGPRSAYSGTTRNILVRASLDSRLAAAAFIGLVVKYDLRWEHEPKRHYPVGEMDWLPVGWLPMVERLVVRLIKLGWNRRLAQVKEKFGGLRFYIGKGSPAVQAAIDRAEVRSFRTCDRCGQAGRQRVEEGSAVRCETHRDRAGRPMGFKVLGSTRPSAAQHFKSRRQ